MLLIVDSDHQCHPSEDHPSVLRTGNKYSLQNICQKWFVNEFLADMVAILLNDKKLEAEGRKLKALNITMCWVLFFVTYIYHLI